MRKIYFMENACRIIIEQILDNKIKNDNQSTFLELRKADYRYEFGVYDPDNNMILVTKATEN